MRIILVGLPYFTEKLYHDLKEFDSENTYFRLDTYYNKKDSLKAFRLIPTADIVYSINGALDKSRVFDWAFFWKKKVMMTWVGTDVIKAKKLDQINQRYLKNAHHYCEVKWIQEELKELAVDAKILNFFNFPDAHQGTMVKSPRLKVLTYISNGREDFYGWKEVMNAARACPEVDFTVVGTSGIGEWPKNVSCLGWVDNMPELFENHHATIRFLAHDGLSGFVLESLSRGKHVIYSEPLSHCQTVKNMEEMTAAIQKLSQMNTDGTLELNVPGMNFIRENFNRTKILSDLIAEMKS